MHPAYNKKDNYFICNKSIVNEYCSLKENNIKNGNLIILIEHSGNCVNAVFVKKPKSKYQIEEEKKIDELSKKIKDETNLDVIVLTNDTENLITLRFQSFDQNINCNVICKDTEIFNSIANKIFEKNQVFKEYGNIFLCNEIQINEYKSIKENKLQNGNIITIKKIREANDDNNDPERESRKLKKLAERIKKQTNIDVIILAKDTKNFLTIRLKSLIANINYYFICKESEIFNRLLNKIFEIKPEFKNAKYSYICNDNGNIIKEYKSLKENGIKDDYLILMNKEEEMIYQVSDNSSIEKKILKAMAYKLKKETQIDVVISAKDTKHLITIKFQSTNQLINCYAICNEKDIFNNVINKIFEKKPEFKEHGNHFLCNGNNINEYKSLFENNIRDKDVIILYAPDDE